MAAYNSTIDRLQVLKLAVMSSNDTKILNSFLVLFEFLLRASHRPFAAARKLCRLDAAAWKEFFDQYSGEGGTVYYCFAFFDHIIFGKHLRAHVAATHNSRLIQGEHFVRHE